MNLPASQARECHTTLTGATPLPEEVHHLSRRAGDALLALAGGRAYGGRGTATALALQIHALAHVARQRGPDGRDAPGVRHLPGQGGGRHGGEVKGGDGGVVSCSVSSCS